MAVLRFLLIGFLSGAPSAWAWTDTASGDFQSCLVSLASQVRAAGIEPHVVDSVFPTIQPRAQVIAADNAQPEFFHTFWQYIDQRVTDQRVERGRELLKKHYRLLHEIEANYGVRPEYLLAFWGLETNYGSVFGKIPLLDALATLACDQRRTQLFTRELTTALSLHQNGDIDVTRISGSWAGAMGHTQFLPSTYSNHAVDFDRDGRKDLFRSLPDVFASASNYLLNIGWKPDERWGREVIVPFRFDWSQAGLDRKKSVSEWRALGLKDAFGRPLPHSEMQGSLLLPMGQDGPAFLLYDNFHVIMEWNRSISYALAVGYLADRIAGMGQLTAKRPDHVRLLSLAEVAEIQALLNELGYDSGTPDGVVGRKTRQAARDFQLAVGVAADGYPDHDLLEQLRRSAR